MRGELLQLAQEGGRPGCREERRHVRRHLAADLFAVAGHGDGHEIKTAAKEPLLGRV